MAAGLHGSARTTPRVRAGLPQASQETTRALAARYGLNEKTVAKWRRRTTTADAPMGPKKPRSAKLTELEEAAVVELRRRALLPLDDMLGCLRERIPQLSRSALHRCLVRHGISRLPRGEEKDSRRGRFADTPIGLRAHRQQRAAPGAGQAAHVPGHRPSDQARPHRLLRGGHQAQRSCLPARCRGGTPYRIHTVPTDNGMAFAGQPRYRGGMSDRYGGGRIFERVCREHGIGHRLTKPYHPWTNGQAERMNRTAGEATVKAFHYPDFEALKAHVPASVLACNFARAPQGAAMAHSLPDHLRCLDQGAGKVQSRPSPSHPGTKHFR